VRVTRLLENLIGARVHQVGRGGAPPKNARSSSTLSEASISQGIAVDRPVRVPKFRLPGHRACLATVDQACARASSSCTGGARNHNELSIKTEKIIVGGERSFLVSSIG